MSRLSRLRRRVGAASRIRALPELHGWTDPAAGLALAALRQRYADLRTSLESLLAQPVKDMPAVDQLVDELEHVQLQIKAAVGIEGNNPRD